MSIYPYAKDLVGDGLVVCSGFGSSHYSALRKTQYGLKLQWPNSYSSCKLFHEYVGGIKVYYCSFFSFQIEMLLSPHPPRPFPLPVPVLWSALDFD